MMKSILLN